MSRVRSQCAVERTLDNCVARLRRKLEIEQLSIVQATDVVYNSRKNTIDRTPSFYTSRSINNLNELAVADPFRAAQSNTEVKIIRDELLSPNEDLVHVTHDAVLNDEVPRTANKGFPFNEFGNSSDELATLASSTGSVTLSTNRSNSSFHSNPVAQSDSNGHLVELRR